MTAGSADEAMTFEGVWDAFAPAFFSLDREDATDGRRERGPLYAESKEVCDVYPLSLASSVKVVGGGPERVMLLVPPFDVERKLETEAGCLKDATVG